MPTIVTTPLTDWEILRGAQMEEPCPREVEVWRDGPGQLGVSQIHEPRAISYRLRFSDQIVVDIRPAQRFIREAVGPAYVCQSTLDHFLADQVLPRVLAHEGTLVLHAGAVALKSAAVLFIGPSGQGKSTLVASLHQAGHPLLGDDALCITTTNGLPHARAVYPSLRLMPDSLEALFPSSLDTEPVAMYSRKQRISVTLPAGHGSETLPIAAIYMLAPPPSDHEIRFCRMNPAAACIALLTNSFALDPTDMAAAGKRLDEVSALARQVPVFELVYPRKYKSLSNVHAAVLQHSSELVESVRFPLN